MTDPCYLDTETRSREAISRGNDVYTRSAECMIVTWALGANGAAQCWDVLKRGPMPYDLHDILLDHSVPLIAHNAAFDRAILRYGLQIETPAKRWRCTRAQAYAHGLPGSVELLGIVLGLPPEERKKVEDKKLIHLFCETNAKGVFNEAKDYPEEWERFKAYATRDTEALRAIHRRLPSTNYSGQHLELFALDQLINARGFGLDTKFARTAIEFLKRAKDVTDHTMADATGGVVTAATQRQRLLTYLQEKHKLNIPNLRAAEVREWLEQDDLNPEVRLLLETRLEAAKSSGSKYRRGIQIVGPQDRLRYCIQFNGAGRTGRFSHKGYQPGNMARPVLNVREPNGRMKTHPVEADYIDDIIMPGVYSGNALNMDLIYGGPNEAAALALRHSLIAAQGNEFVVADWSNIESRILAWIADESWKLDAYRAVDRGEGVDLYRLLYSQFFGTNVEDVNDVERQSGKVSELAFGFHGGVGALVTMSATYQMDLEPLAALVLPRADPKMLVKAAKAWRRAFLSGETYGLDEDVYMACDVLKQTYRASNKNIEVLARDIESAAKAAVANHTSYTVGKCQVWANKAWLIIQLPSGRRILYANPRLHHEIVQDIETKKPIHRNYLSYMTARGMIWRREKAWSGLFIENVVQAIANDVLRVGLMRAHKDTLATPAVMSYLATLPPEERTAIALHVHDEIILDVPRGAYPLKRLIECCTAPIEWAPGLPLAAEGWVNPRYGKRKAMKLHA